jgi:SAM-dependent methyltransferase
MPSRSPAHITHTALRQRLLSWELTRFDEAVADVFGYHALQLGLPELQSLQNSRIQHRWRADVQAHSAPQKNPMSAAHPMTNKATPQLLCDFMALPFADNCLDLVTLPHTLEHSPEAHSTLREVARVLIPEGKLMICGLNPASLWGLQNPALGLHPPIATASTENVARTSPNDKPSAERQRTTAQHMGSSVAHGHPRPWIAYWRLRDWLRLLGFEVESAQLWGYCPAFRSAAWLERSNWLDSVGARWWPMLGGVYFLVATKRVSGARRVGKIWSAERLAQALPRPQAPAPVSSHTQPNSQRQSLHQRMTSPKGSVTLTFQPALNSNLRGNA